MPSQEKNMNLSINRKERNTVLRDVLSKLTREQGDSLSTIGELFGVCKTTIAPLFRDNTLHTVKSESYVKLLHGLGVTIRFKAYIGDKGSFYSEKVYGGDLFDIKAWSIANARAYMERFSLSSLDAANIVGVTRPVMRSHLNQQRTNRTSMFTAIEDFSKLGLTYIMEMEHPIHDIRSIVGVSPINKDKTKKIKNIIPITSKEDDFLSLISDRTISDMGRGLVKTSLGEVIRPFL